MRRAVAVALRLCVSEGCCCARRNPGSGCCRATNEWLHGNGFVVGRVVSETLPRPFVIAKGESRMTRVEGGAHSLFAVEQSLFMTAKGAA